MAERRRVMRSRERLIQILETVNPEVIGGFPARVLARAGRHLQRPSSEREDTIGLIRRYALKHESPHIRELAKEALYYIEQEKA